MKFIPVAKPCIGTLEAKEVYKTLKSNWITMGQKVEKFEKEFALSVNCKYALATNNGTSALHLCLRAIGIKENDEVIIPNITFISTINVVLYEKAIPVLADCSQEDFNILPKEIEKKITNKTKAIIGVDMNGLPFNYDELIKISKKYQIKLIADSAESYGAKYKNKKIGSIAPLHSFSFFANKNILLILFFSLYCCFFWFLKFPVYRFGMAFISSFILFLSINLLVNKNFFYSKKTYYSIIGIGLILFYGKNINRIINHLDLSYNNFPWPMIYSMSNDDKNIKQKFTKITDNQNNLIYYYSGGKECMYSNSPCSNYYKKNILRKNIKGYVIYYLK